MYLYFPPGLFTLALGARTLFSSSHLISSPSSPTPSLCVRVSYLVKSYPHPIPLRSDVLSLPHHTVARKRPKFI
ncbi:hypothetical protein AG1IA_00648 [Rhizoctonia solani AG-1 IA]|uniref:Uncharacterized protein n=1 Tax=Thanatephorus cucumeris (strain AG1-IA) TaxID=983506 RepID=L8X563_THACA|nr:hypothetical protein AG1IA_00648 [Rhizoctonia solani AG-1 IA]